MIVTALFALLIALQPDFGTAAILTGIALAVIVAGGANLKHLFVIGTPVLLGMGLLALKFPHVDQRLTSFHNPWADPYGAGFHLIQSYYAFGHGGITGVGFGRSIQKYEYLPHPHNDFIFSVIAEELGFIGVCFVIFLYMLLIWRILFLCQRMRGNVLHAGRRRHHQHDRHSGLHQHRRRQRRHPHIRRPAALDQLRRFVHAGHTHGHRHYPQHLPGSQPA